MQAADARPPLYVFRALAYTQRRKWSSEIKVRRTSELQRALDKLIDCRGREFEECALALEVTVHIAPPVAGAKESWRPYLIQESAVIERQLTYGDNDASQRRRSNPNINPIVYSFVHSVLHSLIRTPNAVRCLRLGPFSGIHDYSAVFRDPWIVDDCRRLFRTNTTLQNASVLMSCSMRIGETNGSILQAVMPRYCSMSFPRLEKIYTAPLYYDAERNTVCYQLGSAMAIGGYAAQNVQRRMKLASLRDRCWLCLTKEEERRCVPYVTRRCIKQSLYMFSPRSPSESIMRRRDIEKIFS